MAQLWRDIANTGSCTDILMSECKSTLTMKGFDQASRCHDVLHLRVG